MGFEPMKEFLLYTLSSVRLKPLGHLSKYYIINSLYNSLFFKRYSGKVLSRSTT